MSKYELALKDILSIFNSDSWKAFAIPTYPENYKGYSSEYIVITVAFSGIGPNGLSTSGMLFADIYTEVNKGPMRGISIAGLLDSVLNEKSVISSPKRNTQFMRSSVSSVGVDKANPSLYRHTYTIPFYHFGVT